MKIGYLNGSRLYYAFLAGGSAVIRDKDYLNKINVFPVPDFDTGTNLASTMIAIAESAVASPSLQVTLKSIEDAAFLGARGNSGIIFAQFIHGLSQEIKSRVKLTTHEFGESVRRAVHYAYKSLVSPVEGTMLTVIKDWAEAVYGQRTKTADFVELLSHSLQAARSSLKETTKRLSVLARAGVVDAGAKGFVDFLEGIVQFIRQGRLKGMQTPQLDWPAQEASVHAGRETFDHRFCSEALLIGLNLDLERMRQDVQTFGSSAIVAGSEERARIHIHTDHPSELYLKLGAYGSIAQVKVDDMLKQYEVSHNRKAKIALVTDSACDLPQEVIDGHQIQVIPLNLSFGESLFLDKVTITPEQFYARLKASKENPKSAVPPLRTVENLFSFLASHYESILMVSLSRQLSGFHDLCRKAAENVAGDKIQVLNSRNISVSLGLIVMRIAEAIRGGWSLAEIANLAEEWISKTRIFVDINTLKYLVRGGRVTPLKGLLAKVLNLKPILSLDSEGKSQAVAKSFSRRGNMRKILGLIRNLKKQGRIWNYALVHALNRERAQAYEKKMTEILGLKPAFTLDVAPVIGVHSGIGAVAVAVMLE